MKQNIFRLLAFCILLCLSGSAQERRLPQLPDLIGLAWIEGDLFLAVHDAKNPGETERPRVSIIKLPRSPESIEWKPLVVEWPQPLGPSSDLESIARVPGTQSFLLVESGERIKGAPPSRRIFHVEVRGDELKIIGMTELPASVINIEGAAVARAGGRLIFVYAERADNQPGADLIWSYLETEPLRLGVEHRARFHPPGLVGPNWRPVSAIEIDSRGQIYIASALDPDDDSGPFRSRIWKAAEIRQDRSGRIRIVPFIRPRLLAHMDGLKIESLAVRERQSGVELFAGTDDENFGGALRPIPVSQ